MPVIKPLLRNIGITVITFYSTWGISFYFNKPITNGESLESFSIKILLRKRDVSLQTFLTFSWINIIETVQLGAELLVRFIIYEKRKVKTNKYQQDEVWRAEFKHIAVKYSWSSRREVWTAQRSWKCRKCRRTTC